jgi:hypothetical protein
MREDSKEGGADFFIFPDKAPSEMIWCFVDSEHIGSRRLCQTAAPSNNGTEIWTEVYCPSRATSLT